MAQVRSVQVTSETRMLGAVRRGMSGLCLALAAVMLAGCVVYPVQYWHPHSYYYYH